MKKKIILIGIAIILIVAAIVGVKALNNYLERKAESEAYHALNNNTAMGRWIVEDKDFSFIVYMDDQQVYYIKTDLFFDASTGQGMYNMPMGDWDGSLQSPHGTKNDYINIFAKSRPEKDTDCFKVILNYSDKDDTITNDKDTFLTNLIIRRDKDYASLHSTVTDSFNQEGLELIISMLNNKLSSYYRSNITLVNVEFNSGIWGEPVDYNGYISGTAHAKDLDTGESATLDFEIEPVTDPMIFHSIINNTTGEIIVSDYVTSR